MTIAEMSKEELVYLQFLEKQEDSDWEMVHKLSTMFALPEKIATEEVQTYLNFKKANHLVDTTGEAGDS